jgi:hypothetical protein
MALPVAVDNVAYNAQLEYVPRSSTPFKPDHYLSELTASPIAPEMFIPDGKPRTVAFQSTASVSQTSILWMTLLLPSFPLM